jgi:hypothetical protein
VARKPKPPVPPEILAGYRILERFLEILCPLDARRTKDPRELDPRRKFDAKGYFVMMLFTLLNPVIGSMRGLCAVSKSKRFVEGTGLPPVSLGSFSEAQTVFEPEILRGVLRELLSRGGNDLPAELRGKLGGTAVEAIDSTVWEAVGRMGWPAGATNTPRARRPCGCICGGGFSGRVVVARRSHRAGNASGGCCGMTCLNPA